MAIIRLLFFFSASYKDILICCSNCLTWKACFFIESGLAWFQTKNFIILVNEEKQKVNYSRWYVIYYSTYVIMGQRVLKLYREILWSNPPHGVETLVVVGWLFWDIKAGEMMKLMKLWRLGDDKEVGGLVQNRSMIELKAADSHI